MGWNQRGFVGKTIGGVTIGIDQVVGLRLHKAYGRGWKREKSLIKSIQ